MSCYTPSAAKSERREWSYLVRRGSSTPSTSTNTGWADAQGIYVPVTTCLARAAAETSRFRNGRVNNSRVSARTGLSRAVVRKVLRPDFLRSIPLTWAPVDAVMQAWCADRRFKDYNGIPRTLKIVGRRTSFQSLAKLYAGDLPYRAILDEMKALGLAVTKQNSVACIPSVVRKRYARMSLRPRTKAIHLRSIVDSSHAKHTRKKNQLTSEA